MIENMAQLQSFYDLLRTLKVDRKAYAAPDYSKARFRLGTSLAETKIPFYLDAPLRDTLKTAMDTLFLAVPMRHRDEIGPAELDAVLLDPGSLTINLRPPSWYVGDVPPDSVFFRIITRSMRHNRRLDAGLLLWWFGKDAPGRNLVTELNRYLNKLDTEGRELGRGEETMRFGLLALLHFWSRYRSPVTERARHPLFTEAYNAAALVHYHVLKALLEERYRASGVTERPIGDPAAAAYQALLLPLSPLAFAASEINFGADAVGPFGLSSPSLQALERFFPRMLERATPPTEALKQVLGKIAPDKAAPGIILHDVRVQKIYEAALEILWRLKTVEPGSPEGAVFEEIQGILKDPNDFLKKMDDKKLSKEWAEQWKRITFDAIRPNMEAFQNAALGLAKLSEGFFSDKAALEKAYTEHAQRFVVLRHFEAVNAGLLDQTRILQEFTGLPEQRTEDYEKGQLYRFAADDHAILKSGVMASEAQLFIDLKDFTKRTFSSKEAAMADFMKLEFYEPILKAGKNYMANMAQIEENSITINNLLGDAISAAGNVRTLLRFAYDIICVGEEYRKKLKDKMPAGLIDGKLKEIEEKFKTTKAALESERARYLAPAQKLMADMNALPPADPKRVPLSGQIRGYQEAAGAADRKLKQLIIGYQDDRSFIEGSGLETGAYIAFGSKAETLTFKDEVFGNLKVAIGEKINESARGTARDASVRNVLNHFLDKARAAAKTPDLEYPFKVFVDNSIQTVLDPDLELMLRTAITAKDADGIKKLVTTLSQRLMNDLVNNVKKDEPDFRSILMGNGIYNLGLAISSEAVESYLAAIEGKRPYIKRDLAVAELHEEIKRKFAFPRTNYPMILVAPDYPGEPVEVFVEVGSMVFKGFERKEPQVIYERLLHTSLFYRYLTKHHLQAWMAKSA